MFNQFGGAVDLSLQELEDQLIELCAASDSALEPDLIYGFNGIGVYALERWPSKFTSDCIPLLIERLANASWSDLGLAHGAAGVIAFLSAAARLDSGWRTHIRPVVKQHVDRLLQQRLPANETTCAFPSEIGGGPTRLGWCLGDTSIAVALLAAGTAFDREDWCNTARELALAAARRPRGFSGVVDAGLCHGAAGLGHVFNRLFQATGEQRLALAARGSALHWTCRHVRLLQFFCRSPNCSAKQWRCQRMASRNFQPGPTAKARGGIGSPIAAFSLAPQELGSR
jgi:hypothetical protein